MASLPKRIMEHAEALPEAAPICPGALLHLGNRPAVDQALSRLARRGQLLRVHRGVYMRPFLTEFGVRPPSPSKVIESLSALWGETIVPSGGASANVLGLTKQVPIRSVYWTSGPRRKLRLFAIVLELRHAPRWQLVAPGRPAGMAVRALAWVGPHEIEESLDIIKRELSEDDLMELAATRAILPSWMAGPLSTLVSHG
ncbi:MAG: type IV toxin-antitoxin system AbiEi family antitoxin domain-containing protein [Gemmatimonadetes bacterium]|nr:type IV toxin-antitoxin system AbiEi family antitoxin domain-containing protein [Gemmatimonadota bacterium]MXX70816.1 type IV toxin-antitoxin system AbiEi family antitoxin domain-containing protein [Gemmatimonadota bacterium]MYC90555.1 type IV toxin-antitoxin system AbiEi family antitoxin domain-containing protein [Gemmatimonadota bacterium]MYG36417.1 type IV toxin-antitoxin system AbiEi family antitoxin domain-containing protein [Gemmatimonadota bacterium]MYJ18864.1 type IV toxin-antitoxin 